jgi:ATP-binding cassette subfamily D (ALD) long-chain fatty acid import protein
LFYHKPAFAILDECTSNLNMELEGKLYQQAMDLGITLITVTHRPSLWKYHNYLLQFDGQGGVHFSDLNSMERLTLKEEKGRLEEKLLSVTKMEARLKTLYEMLGNSNQNTPDTTPNSTPKK